MRHKDESKRQALLDATIAIANQEGLVATSIQKIGKKAHVSPATLYIYFENKNDLLLATFLDIKRELSDITMAGFDPQGPLQNNLKGFWLRLFNYVTSHPDKYNFIDQFSYSPFMKLVDLNLIEAPYRPLYQALEKGVVEQQLKAIARPTQLAFLLAPAVFLARSRLGSGFDASAENLDATFLLAWQAIAD